MYTLMNQNRALMDFAFEYQELSGEYKIKEQKVYERPWFLTDLNRWARYRHAPRHRANINKLLNLLGLYDIKSLFDCSKGLSLTDTLWVNCDDKYQWEEVNLFDHPFDDIIAGIAFNGELHSKISAMVSPELTTDGALSKCWIREGDGIYLLKQGSGNFARNSGLEPYSEQYCSQILDVLGYDHVQYEAVTYRGKLASRCRLLTGKEKMMIPLAACIDNHDYKTVVEFCNSHQMLDQLYQTIVFDYLVTNDDRHLNNIAVAMDADTFAVQGLAPIFDNGAGLLPFATEENLSDYAAAVGYTAGKGPRFYGSFYQAARYALDRMDSAPVHRLLDFTFPRQDRHSLPEWRICALEQYVRSQARHLLDGKDPLDIVRRNI